MISRGTRDHARGPSGPVLLAQQHAGGVPRRRKVREALDATCGHHRVD
eukprot:CAMPEP_0174340170 /NCGR_PEP_ID=MMETSP0810-20121108/24491_1 /TAXON_ID=73025 ORGANISM="Eutreptiella gymnastica-like, Strain CCMP1594" /NCGR_SAMPLE_ID=MMETSP0810 /ASSEMBLY_ACC=CAM_ASM_000659 /LENGTH=47 /DNA_ID= /DNA_START= /DNA_END= /DNA_ORIENTATION=